MDNYKNNFRVNFNITIFKQKWILPINEILSLYKFKQIIMKITYNLILSEL
jgi:hypothetical protein